MFKISTKAKHGGLWDGKHVVKELETDDAAMAERFRAQGCRVDEVEIPLDKMNVQQLKKYAKEHDIDIGEASTKDAILAAIEAASQ